MVEPIRVLIADDNTSFRRGLRALLQGTPEIEVAGEAATGQEAVGLADRMQVDVVLMDIKMPDMNGIGILMLTMLEDDDSVFAAMRAGARGYLLKGALKAELLRAIRGVSSGDAIFGAPIARRLMDFFATTGVKATPAFPELTRREQEILALMAQHLTNPVIATRLSLSPKTVRNIVSSIFNKLQVADRAEAIVRARDAGLGRGMS
jgi:DNA-binding NarL/FixJ family response regulator